MGAEPISSTEFGDIDNFIRELDEDGSSRFTQAQNVLVDKIQLPSKDVIRIDVTYKVTGRTFAIELRSNDFPQDSEHSNLDSSDYPMSHRIFEMTVALTEFGHTTSFDLFNDGMLIRVLPGGTFAQV